MKVICVYCKKIFEREAIRGRNKNGFVCPKCHNKFRKTNSCFDCQNTFIMNDLKCFDNVILCNNCINNRNRICVMCGDISKSHGKQQKGDHICISCYKKSYKTPKRMCSKCYQADYIAPTEKCYICRKEKPIQKKHK